MKRRVQRRSLKQSPAWVPRNCAISRSADRRTVWLAISTIALSHKQLGGPYAHRAG